MHDCRNARERLCRRRRRLLLNDLLEAGKRRQGAFDHAQRAVDHAKTFPHPIMRRTGTALVPRRAVPVRAPHN